MNKINIKMNVKKSNYVNKNVKIESKNCLGKKWKPSFIFKFPGRSPSSPCSLKHKLVALKV